MAVDLRPCFSHPQLDTMNFLNEVMEVFPQAISFAPGRPHDTLLDVQQGVAALDEYVGRTATEEGCTPRAVWQRLGQYGRTNGFCADVIATHLALDENIHVGPESIMVTVGAQEAMAILIAGLFEPSSDVLLVSNPTYIGITGLARIHGVRVVPVNSGDNGLEPTAVAQAIETVSRNGRVRALYDIPDFNNPLGTSMPVEHRRELLSICRKHEVLLIEDNPYGMYAYDHGRAPTVKSLDRSATTVYVGSFSKTLFPGLRVGYLVADQRVTAATSTLAQELSRVKSLISVNTPPLAQAIVAALLRRAGGSLEPIIAAKRGRYKEHRDEMLRALHDEFGGMMPMVSWNAPGGGFFLTMTLPFAFGPTQLRACAADYGVVVTPMQFFTLDSSRRNQIRLSFSSVDAGAIRDGVRRLGRFVRDQVRRIDSLTDVSAQ